MTLRSRGEFFKPEFETILNYFFVIFMKSLINKILQTQVVGVSVNMLTTWLLRYNSSFLLIANARKRHPSVGTQVKISGVPMMCCFTKVALSTVVIIGVSIGLQFSIFVSKQMSNVFKFGHLQQWNFAQ